MTQSPTTDVWGDLVTVGLLGTDRREPPELAPGPVGDVVADAVRSTPHGRLLASVSAMVVARRCGAQPLPSRPPLMSPPADSRPMLPVAAAQRWTEIVAHWPVLEPEWLAVASARGWRPSPDVLVALIRRHRRSPFVAAAVVAFGGSVASWLVEHLPDLAPYDTGRPASALAETRTLPVPADLNRLLDGPADVLADAVVTGLTNGTFKWSHRAVLLNAIARLPRRSLDVVIAALELGREAIECGGPGSGATGAPLSRGPKSLRPKSDRPKSGATGGAPLSLWESLIELATVRRSMLDELDRRKAQ